MNRYSRRRAVEERNSVRKAYWYILISIVLIFLMIFYGIPLLSRFALFTANLRGGTESINFGDTTPPAPPGFDEIPDFTNEESLEVTGRSEEGSVVTIYTNLDQKEILTDKEGKFTFVFELSEGENTFYAIAKDTSGNTSQETGEFIVVFDNTDPELKITGPGKSSFFGQSERQIVIQGETEKNTSITINDRSVVVDANGKFSFNTSLVDGENIFVIVAEDRAGNQTTEEIKLTFTP